MKKEKKYIIIILLGIFLLITLLIIYLSNQSNNVDVNPNLNNPNLNQGKTFRKVNNYEEFFSVQNTLNNTDAFNVSIIVNELYLNEISNTKYYFIRASKFVSDLGAETVDYEKDIYYILIVDSNNFYELSEVSESFNDLESYAKNYPAKIVNINSNKKMKSGTTSIESVISIYIEHFKNMIVVDPLEAFNMLSNNAQKKYVGYSDFYNQSINVYNKLSSKIFGLNQKEEENVKIYYVDDNNRNKIIIYEEDIMNFKIYY